MTQDKNNEKINENKLKDNNDTIDFQDVEKRRDKEKRNPSKRYCKRTKDTPSEVDQITRRLVTTSSEFTNENNRCRNIENNRHSSNHKRNKAIYGTNN